MRKGIPTRRSLQLLRNLSDILASHGGTMNPRIRTGAPHYLKFLIWARAVLISKFEKGLLERAGIVKGVLASLYQVENCWPLLEAFISFWNSDGHTIVTSQGEMGYPLLALQDAMGIPISGRLYDEYVPDNAMVAKNPKVPYPLLSGWITFLVIWRA